VGVARPQRGGEAVTIRVEDEQRMIADGLEVTVVGRLLLRAVDRVLGAADIQARTPHERAGRLVMQQISIGRTGP
jgi:hypothetical protein